MMAAHPHDRSVVTHAPLPCADQELLDAVAAYTASKAALAAANEAHTVARVRLGDAFESRGLGRPVLP
jgi:hypothetical protein